MPPHNSLDDLLQGLWQAWLHLSAAAAARPPAVLPASPAVDTASLFPGVWMRPAALSLSFDCELRPARGGQWLLHVVGGRQRRWGRPRHVLDIRLDGDREGRVGGVVRFDGQTLRRFGAADRQEPS